MEVMNLQILPSPRQSIPQTVAHSRIPQKTMAFVRIRDANGGCVFGACSNASIPADIMANDLPSGRFRRAVQTRAPSMSGSSNGPRPPPIPFLLQRSPERRAQPSALVDDACVLRLGQAICFQTALAAVPPRTQNHSLQGLFSS